MIGCHDPSRAAYGWQRDGGHAPYLLAEEITCLGLPESLSYEDGACVACGFGTAYEALLRIGVSGRDQVLVTGLGPVGLAVGMLARALGARRVLGTDPVAERVSLADELGLFDEAFTTDSASDRIDDATGGHGVEASIDASGSPAGRLLALGSTRDWGRCVFVGEGGSVTLDVSPLLIHRQITLRGSWVTSLGHMAELLDRLDRWRLRPSVIITDRFPLDRAAEAYQLADGGRGGKVALIPTS